MEIGYYHATGQTYDYGLWGYLGCLFLGDGNSTNNVSQIHGQNLWYGAGMLFDYPYGQAPDSWVDILGPAGVGSLLQFLDQLNNGHVVSYVSPGQGYRTITSGVCFCAFGENAPMSTQQRLMARIMGFLLADDTTPPAAVGPVEVAVNGSMLDLSWDPVTEDTGGNPEAVDSYVVERATSLTGSWSAVGITVMPSFTDQPAGLGNPDLNCYYRIKAVDTTGNLGVGSFSGEFDYQIDHP